MAQIIILEVSFDADEASKARNCVILHQLWTHHMLLCDAHVHVHMIELGFSVAQTRYRCLCWLPICVQSLRPYAADSLGNSTRPHVIDGFALQHRVYFPVLVSCQY